MTELKRQLVAEVTRLQAIRRTLDRNNPDQVLQAIELDRQIDTLATQISVENFK